jgi:hypothetical protein
MSRVVSCAVRVVPCRVPCVSCRILTRLTTSCPEQVGKGPHVVTDDALCLIDTATGLPKA